MSEQKLFPNKSKITGYVIGFTIVFILILYFIFGSRFNYINKDQETLNTFIIRDVILVFIGIAAGIVTYVILTTQNYYIILNSELVHHRFNNELHYRYSDIVYIDKEYTMKHKVLLFYTSKGDDRYLVLDNDGRLLKILEDNCRNLITKEDFKRRFKDEKH